MRVFVSYRRGATTGFAERLADELRKSFERDFGSDTVFLDTSAIKSGEKFRGRILEAIAQCDVFVAVIGKDWATERLKDPDDVVRFEITAALARDNLTIIPVLASTEPPERNDLPQSIIGLLDRNAARIDLGEDSDRDIQRLVDRIEQLLKHLPQSKSGGAEQALVSQSGPDFADKKRRLMLAAALIVAVLGVGKWSMTGACGSNNVIVSGGEFNQGITVKTYWVSAAGAQMSGSGRDFINKGKQQ